MMLPRAPDRMSSRTSSPINIGHYSTEPDHVCETDSRRGCPGGPRHRNLVERQGASARDCRTPQASCCTDGAACCYPGSPCCEDDCCAAGTACCNPPRRCLRRREDPGEGERLLLGRRVLQPAAGLLPRPREGEQVTPTDSNMRGVGAVGPSAPLFSWTRGPTHAARRHRRHRPTRRPAERADSAGSRIPPAASTATCCCSASAARWGRRWRAWPAGPATPPGSRRRVIGVGPLLQPRSRSTGSEATASRRCAATCSTRRSSDALPDAANVVFMTGMKFGSTGQEALTWAMNCHLPALVAATLPPTAGSSPSRPATSTACRRFPAAARRRPTRRTRSASTP